jgi:hypothetical protein
MQGTAQLSVKSQSKIHTKERAIVPHRKVAVPGTKKSSKKSQTSHEVCAGEKNMIPKDERDQLKIHARM